MDLHKGETELNSITWRSYKAYTFLLLLSVSGGFRTNDKQLDHYPTALFEDLVRDAFEAWWGGHAVVMLRKHRAIRALKSIANLLGVSQPRRADPRRQDHGVDIIAWRPFTDRHEAVPVVLCQCTVSASGNAPVLKARDVVLNEWTDLLHVPFTAFVRSVAVPRCLPVPAPRWWDITRATDLFLDRSRIIEMLAGGQAIPSIADASLQARITVELARLRAGATKAGL